jgi:hypothetical protein
MCLIRTLVPVAFVVAALTVSSLASASQLIDRDATNVHLEVNAKGEAMLTYTAHGTLKHVLAWGAVNAMAPKQGTKQVAFSLDYSGGYGSRHVKSYWAAAGWSCKPYSGAKLAWEVAACIAPDGSFWAVQAWQRALPDYGVAPTGTQAAWELHLSHWTGSAPSLAIDTDWAYRKFDQLFGTFTFDGAGVYGFKATSSGQPLDSFGRNIYVDTLDSAYGPGWKRENSFLTHGPKGSFCYGLFAHGSHPAGNGTQYRATVEGPGVAPDAMWTGSAPGPYDAAADAEANTALAALGDSACRPN